MEFQLFLPQMRLPYEKLVATAQQAEAAGFSGIVGMDHITAPGADSQPMFDCMITNTWIAAHTKKIKVGSLVMCDTMRHPAILAKEAVSIDHASGGRFELGIGWGSQESELVKFGVTPTLPRERVARLRETLEVLKALWAGETVNYDGQYHHLKDATQAPLPKNIPILIGGSGPKTLALVRDYADWWNLDIRHRDKLTGEKFEELRAQIGKARISIQQMAAYVAPGGDHKAIGELALKRFGHSEPVIGTGPELLEHFGKLAAQGVERTYVWFCDFAPPETLAGFGEEVIAKLP